MMLISTQISVKNGAGLKLTKAQCQKKTKLVKIGAIANRNFLIIRKAEITAMVWDYEINVNIPNTDHSAGGEGPYQVKVYGD